MKIASWNVNSIKVRKDHVEAWLRKEQPDVLLLQELKGTEFPADHFESLGYQSEAVVQKARNGVAVLSKRPFEVNRTALIADDEQARYIEITVEGLRIIGIYAPNGNPVDTEKYPYKLNWTKELKAYLESLLQEETPFVVGGDFNVIPANEDCYDPAGWAEDALFRLETRQLYRSILNMGLTDAYRVFNHKPHQYTFWDYQAGAWQKGNGIRIDHFLLSPQATDRLKSCTIDPTPRGWDTPSDHTPIMVELS